MNLNTIRQSIIESEREDWNKITCWGAGSGPIYHYGLSSERGDKHGVETEVKAHANLAVLIEDVDISIAWGYDPDESHWGGKQQFDFSDFLPSFPDADGVSRMYVDVFYRGALVDRELYVVADGGRHYVPIPRSEYPNRTGYGAGEQGEPEHHYTKWDIGLAELVNSFETAGPFSEVLDRIDYVLDEDRPIWSEGK